jgi:hypothetical protein
MIEKIISFKKASYLVLGTFCLLSLFHLIVIIGILIFDYVPNEYLWGGRLKTREEFLQFEVLSQIMSFFCLIIVLIRSQLINITALLPFSRVVIWLLFILFIFNTLFNLVSNTIFEKVFSVITIILSILCLRLALEPIVKKENE